MRELKLNIGSVDLVALVSGENAGAMIALRPLVEALGLDWTTQLKKVSGNTQFSCRHMPTTGSDGKQYEMLCIPVDEIGMWLCNINARKVKLEVRDRLIQFQKKLQIVIYEAIMGRVSPEIVLELSRAVGDLRRELAMTNFRLDETTEIAKKWQEENVSLKKKVAVLEANAYRFETAEGSAAASRLAHKRWAEEERKKAQLN